MNPALRLSPYGGAALLLASIPKVYSQAPQPMRQPNSMPVAQVVGRVQINSDLTVDLFGYYTIAEGFNFPLFNGDPGEKTAVLTYRADKAGARPLYDGSLLQSLERPLAGNSAALSVYPGSYVATSGIVLEQAQDFTGAGQRYNIRNQTNGLSLMLNGPAPSIESLLAQIAKDGSIQIEQAGTAWNASAN